MKRLALLLVFCCTVALAQDRQPLKVITIFMADAAPGAADDLTPRFITRCASQGLKYGLDFRFVDSLNRRVEDRIYDYRVVLSGHDTRGLARARGDVSVFDSDGRHVFTFTRKSSWRLGAESTVNRLADEFMGFLREPSHAVTPAPPAPRCTVANPCIVTSSHN